MSLRGPATQHLHTATQHLDNEARSAEFDGTGWTSWTGWTDGTEIKSVLEFSSYFVGIQIRYIPTYTCDKKLPPTFLWVLKFDVKLGFGEHNFRNYPMYVSFQIFGSKSCLFFVAYIVVF